MNDKTMMVISAVAMMALGVTGCITSPYDSKVENEDQVTIEDSFARTERMARLKVAVRPATNDEGKVDFSRQVCAKIKDLIATSADYEIAVRDDLLNIRVEDVVNGGEETDATVVPSELLVLVNAHVTSYLGGTTPGMMRAVQDKIEEARRQGDGNSVLLFTNKLRAMSMKSVDNPKDAFGIAATSSCRAYNSANKRQYVADFWTGNTTGENLGRPDVVIGEAADTIARQFMDKLDKRIGSSMKVEFLVSETRKKGEWVKVDISAMEAADRPRQGGRALVYTHVKGRKGAAKRNEIAAGEVYAVEGDSVWVHIERENGYGQPHIGHCVEFN